MTGRHRARHRADTAPTGPDRERLPTGAGVYLRPVVPWFDDERPEPPC